MKRGLVALTLAGMTIGANAQYYQPRQQPMYGTGSNPNSHYVQPHYNNNGSYTGGHYQTNPNQTQTDNYGAPGNFNPHTGMYAPQRRNYP